jgi:hypothetical protein
MGRQSFSCIGYGMTEQEALREARSRCMSENGHQEGYSGDINSATEMRSKCIKQPKPAKRCNVEKTVQKGARKWETVFVIEPTFGEQPSVECRGTQGEAIKQAKALSLKNQCRYSVYIEKRLSSGNSRIAVMYPQKSEQGEWKFWGEAR